MTVLIFANGDIADVGWIRPYLAQATAIIAADGGARHVLALGRLPDVVVGDMDSLPPQLAEMLAQETAVPSFIRYPVHKDETDLELALLHAAQVYADEMLVFGAFGGRVDHFLANISLLALPALAGRVVQFVDEHQRLWLLDAARGAAEIVGQAGDTVSLLPLGQDVVVTETTGLQWTLRNEALAFGPARGISNMLTADRATVRVGSGQLICVHTAQRWGR